MNYYAAKFKRERMLKEDPTIRACELLIHLDRAGITRVVDMRPASQKKSQKGIDLSESMTHDSFID